MRRDLRSLYGSPYSRSHSCGTRHSGDSVRHWMDDRCELSETMQIVAVGLNVQSRIVADLAICRDAGGGNAKSGLMQSHQTLRAVVNCMDHARDRYVSSGKTGRSCGVSYRSI